MLSQRNRHSGDGSLLQYCGTLLKRRKLGFRDVKDKFKMRYALETEKFFICAKQITHEEKGKTWLSVNHELMALAKEKSKPIAVFIKLFGCFYLIPHDRTDGEINPIFNSRYCDYEYRTNIETKKLLYKYPKDFRLRDGENAKKIEQGSLFTAQA